MKAIKMPESIGLVDCQRWDLQDPLASLREQFVLPRDVIYLDGNSLGAMPKAAAARVQQVTEHEWAQGLIGSWNHAHWFDLPNRVGDKIAQLIGASPAQVLATDSTSINLFKVLSVALCAAAKASQTRRVVLSERSNFPTDLYIAQSLCQQHGMTLELCEANEIAPRLQQGDVAVLMLTHVDYRSGGMHDMAAFNQLAASVGALTVWDLAHSAGAVPIQLEADAADFAVGCGYKYFNGGPGAPAFIWVNPKHAETWAQPLSGWWGHARPFAFKADYQAALGVQRYACGTQPIISLAALECGVDSLLAASKLTPDASHPMRALREKSLALSTLFMRLIEQRCADFGLVVVTPKDPAKRGSHVSLQHSQTVPSAFACSSAYAIVQALIARGVVGDFRAGDASAPAGSSAHADLLRFGFAPAYLSFADLWHAVEHLRQVLQSAAWQEPQFQQTQAVT